MVIDGRTALSNLSGNPQGRWRPWARDDPGSLVFYDTAKVRFDYDGRKLSADDGVFTMGSCFAREIERALTAAGRKVLSSGEALTGPEFRVAGGELSDDFLNRFTPASMLQEFQAAFGKLEGWSEEALIFRRGLGKAVDLNYWPIPGADESHRAVLLRRRRALELVRRAAEARMIVLTLGLVEAWRHRPTGLWVNAISPQLLARQPADFELVLLDVPQVLDCLEQLQALLRQVHARGDFELVVTVSPIPLQATFTGQDVIVANAEGKAVLRASAAAFTRGRPNTHYFPSYELVAWSNPARTWKNDAVHLGGRTVAAIVELFTAGVYAA